MKICVLSGSPKGEYSITWQTVRYLEKRFPEDSFQTVHVGRGIRALERDLSPALTAIAQAELLLFCYPVYTFLAPYQLQRFVELLKAADVDLSGKFAAQLSTSKHFYDVTAQRYIEENCADLGLAYLGGLSADMEDLTKPQGQAEAEAFWRLVKHRAAQRLPLPDCRIAPQPQPPYVPCAAAPVEKSSAARVVIVATGAADPALAAMIADFRALWPGESRVVDLDAYPFAGGCLGCFRCAATGKCVYHDGFDDFLRGEIQTADATVYAFPIRDHSMGARMKLYDDRQFCNGHRTVTAGKPTAYLIRGDLRAEPNLRMVLEGRGAVGGNFIAGMATDAAGVAALAHTLHYALEEGLRAPTNFLGVGGMKIFRDLIWTMQGMMKADHRFYRAHGFYDFPQKQRATIWKMKLVGLLLSNPKIVAKMGNKMNEGMLAPYQKVLSRLD